MILVDGDVVRYRCGFAAEKTRYRVWEQSEDGQESMTVFPNAAEAKEYMAGLAEDMSELTIWRESFQEIEPVENALHSVKTLMGAMQERWPDEKMVVFFSCPTPENWRTSFFPQYKANRKPRKPAHDEAISNYMWGKYHCEARESYEADDLIGIYAREHPGSIVATNDKDMDQIPGKHYDFTKSHEYDVLPDEAAYVRELQNLMGDSTDNIPGIQGVGLVGAQKLLEVWDTAWGGYKSIYATEEAARYWFEVNRAMVSLPTCYEDVEIWMENIKDAREAFDALPQDGEADMPGVECSGAGVPSPTETETQCA